MVKLPKGGGRQWNKTVTTLFSEVIGENEKCVFYCSCKSEWTFWPTQHIFSFSVPDRTSKLKTFIFFVFSLYVFYLKVSLINRIQSLKICSHNGVVFLGELSPCWLSWAVSPGAWDAAWAPAGLVLCAPVGECPRLSVRTRSSWVLPTELTVRVSLLDFGNYFGFTVHVVAGKGYSSLLLFFKTLFHTLAGLLWKPCEDMLRTGIALNWRSYIGGELRILQYRIEHLLSWTFSSFVIISYFSACY